MNSKLEQLKLVKWQMVNTVAYPDLILKKFFGVDSSEDPTAFIRLLEKKIVSVYAVEVKQMKITYKSYMIKAKPFLDPFYAVKLLSSSIDLIL